MITQLRPSFICHIADRLGCGLAIILRGLYLQLKSDEEWALISILLDSAAHYERGRCFVFDGIVSCIEHSLPNSIEPGQYFFQENDDESMPVQCALMIVKILCKFVSGVYENDSTYASHAVYSLEKVYNYLCHRGLIEINEGEEKIERFTPDHKLWNNVCNAFHLMSLSSENDLAEKGIESLHRMLLSPKVHHIPHEGWITILDLLTAKHPMIKNEKVRMKSFDLLVRMLLIHTPPLCQREEHLKMLTIVINRTVGLAAENLNVGRQGSVSSLFESTVQLVTNLSNVLLMPSFASDSKFCTWAGNLLIMELEKVGAGGGSIRMIAATSADA